MEQLGVQSAGAAGLPGENGEYTFSDKELQDILVFLEHQNKPGSSKLEASNLPSIPPVFGQASPNTIAAQLPMQFLPHHPVPQSPSANPHLPGSTPYPGQQGPAQAAMSAPYPASMGMHMCMGAQMSQGMMSQHNVPVYTQSLSMKELYSPVGASPSPSSSMHKPPPAEKPQISHSTVEKQRRDRINNLIDELRELVPPQNVGNGPNEGQEVKRAKHVVLSDTIMLLKKLQTIAPLRDLMTRAGISPAAFDVKSEPGAETRDTGNSHPSQLLGLQMRGPEHSRENSGNSRELPLPPQNQNSNGVVVEHQDHSYLVKVNCKDRRGLLADVISSLKSLDLEIITAAVTTTTDGTVHDVFEVRSDASITPEDVQCHVHSCVYHHFNANEKRLRP